MATQLCLSVSFPSRYASVPSPSSPFKTLPFLLSLSATYILLHHHFLHYFCLIAVEKYYSISSLKFIFILLYYHFLVISCFFHSSFLTYNISHSYSFCTISVFLVTSLILNFCLKAHWASTPFDSFHYLSFYILTHSPLFIHLFSFPAVCYLSIYHATLFISFSS